MSSDVQICNRGLARVGIQRITSLTGDEPAAQACNIHYSDNLALLLSWFPWSFAIARQTMAKLATNDRENEWLFAYQKPTNSLRIRWINDPQVARVQGLLGEIPSVPYELSGTTIFSDMDNAVCEFINLITDASLYPPAFQNALSWMIAADVVVSVTEDTRRASRADQEARAAVEAAMAEDAALNIQTDEQPPDWITSRGATDFQMAGYDPEGVRAYYRRRL